MRAAWQKGSEKMMQRQSLLLQRQEEVGAGEEEHFVEAELDRKGG